VLLALVMATGAATVTAQACGNSTFVPEVVDKGGGDDGVKWGYGSRARFVQKEMGPEF
jgi:hypothetical protein